MIITWREWFNEAAVKQLTEMKSLPLHKEDIYDADIMDGDEVAEVIAERAHAADHDNFAHGGTLVIIEPAQFAGTYDVETQYEPLWRARKRDPDEEQ